MEKNIKAAIVCIAKNEDLYIEEWVNYHLSIGFSHIYVYDNNDTKTETLLKLAENPNITVIDVLGRNNLIKKNYQPGCYKEAYFKYGNLYDWIAFFDIDEFLVLHNYTLNEFLTKFKDTDVIHINWRYFGDNDLVFYDNRPVMKRFKNPAPENVKYAKTFPENNHVKSIIKTKLPFTYFGCHTFYYGNTTKCLHANGKPSNPKLDVHPYDFTNAQINHYGTKTIDEYIRRRCLSSKVASHNKDITAEQRLKWFFNVNKHTSDKDELVKFILSKLK